MKRFLTGFAFLVTIVQFLPLSFAAAQEKTEKEEIIIRKKGNKKEKLTIVVDGDNITVNGKPVEKGDKNIIIEKIERGDHPVEMRIPHMRISPRMYHYYERDADQLKRKSMEMIKEYRKKSFHDAFLGVITEENEKGTLISEVVKESAAEKAGLKKGDIILKVSEKAVKNTGDIAEVIEDNKPGDEVEVVYLRDGKEKKVTVKLGEHKNRNYSFNFDSDLDEMNGRLHGLERSLGDMNFRFEPMEPLHFNYPGFDEMVLWNATPQIGITIQDTEEENGVKVLDVDAESPAAKSGVKTDDLITEVNGKKITNVNQAREALREKNEKNTWSIKVLRSGSPVTIEVKIPRKLKKADL
jgi:serine protease Do